MFQVHGGMKEDTMMELMTGRASTSPSGTLRSGATTTARWSRPPWTGTTGSGRRIRYGCASDNTITKVGRITVNYFSTPFRTTSGPRIMESSLQRPPRHTEHLCNVLLHFRPTASTSGRDLRSPSSALSTPSTLSTDLLT